MSKKKRRPGSWDLVTYAELDAWRQRQRLTKNEAAEIFGVTNTTYYNWARGVSVPASGTQQRVRRILNDGRNETVKGVPVYHTPSTTPAAVEVTGKIVEAWLTAQGKRKVPTDELAKVVRGVRRALK